MVSSIVGIIAGLLLIKHIKDYSKLEPLVFQFPDNNIFLVEQVRPSE